MSNLIRLTLYGLIVALDIDLRDQVKTQLGNNRAPEEVLSSDILAKVRDRASRDALGDEADIYDYLDFPDSIQTLRRHIAALDPTISKFLRTNSHDLERLTPIRNRVMHGRPLQFTDYSTVDTFVQKLRTYPRGMFERVVEFEEKVRENPNFVYSLDLSRIEPSSDRIPHNLPLPDYDETGFLGREQENKELLNACKSNWPVITVVGEGGFGKTALALKVAYDLLDDEHSDFEAIVWATAKRTVLTLDDIQTIDGAIQDSLGLIKSAAAILGAQTSEDVVLDEVADYLNNFKILLILDNLETVLDPLLTKFIRRSSGKSKILATSRVGIGEMSYPFKLGGLSVPEAVQLLRTLAKVRRLPDIYKAKAEILREYVKGMKLNPGFIKWFVSCVQCGRRPDHAITNPKTFLDFCLANVYEHVSPDGKRICKALVSVPGRHSLPMISVLSGLSGDDLQYALASLQSANILSMSSVLTEAGGETVYELNELPRLYVLKNHPPSADEDAHFKQLKREVSKQYARLQAQHGGNRYNPRSIACRNQADAITAKLLSEALALGAQNDDEGAIRIVARAKELDPSFYEVYRVEGWIEAYRGRPAAASEAYQTAIALEPNSAPLRFWYGGFLLRTVEDLSGAEEQLLAAESLDPDSAAILVELARIEMYLSRADDADLRLQRVFDSVGASTRLKRMGYDTWIQIQVRAALIALDEGRYSDSLAHCNLAYDRFTAIPSEFHDERIFGTIRRTLGVLSQLSDKLAVSALRPNVEECYNKIDALTYDPLSAMELPFSHVSTRSSECDDSDIGKRFEGVIDLVNLSKRFGFIAFDDKRVFFHFSGFPNAISYARKGAVVSFTVVEQDGRYRAADVRPVAARSDTGSHPRAGIIKSVIVDKSFGFVSDEGGGDLFFHRSDLQPGTRLEDLEPGTAVEYVLGRNHKGVTATQIKAI